MTTSDLDALAAVVFDCDGTLVDSERVSRSAMAQVLAEDGHDLTEDDYHAVVGRAWPHTRAYLAAAVGYDEAGLSSYRDRVGRAFRERMDEVVVFADVAVTLEALDLAGVPMAVCTSSGRPYLERLLRLPELDGRFKATVARQDTDQHKPLPAPYLLAAERLGVPPHRCVVVEDTPTGVTAARVAGMRVMGVDRGLGLDLSSAHRVVTRVTPTDLVAVAAS